MVFLLKPAFRGLGCHLSAPVCGEVTLRGRMCDLMGQACPIWLASRELGSLEGLLQLSPAVLSLVRSASDFYSLLSFLNKSAFLQSWRNNQSPMISPSGKFTKLLSIFCFLGRACQNFWVPSMKPECKVSLRAPS